MTARRVRLEDLSALGLASPVGPGTSWDNPWKAFSWPQWSTRRPWAVGLLYPGGRDVYGTAETEHGAAVHAVGLYLEWLSGSRRAYGRWSDALADQREDVLATVERGRLGGRDLACPCPIGWPCHADYLVRIGAGESPRNLLNELIGRVAA